MQPETEQYNDPYCTDCANLKCWIECILVDEFNKPLAGIGYTLTVRGAGVRKGQTDKQGYLRQDNLPCTLATLTLDAQSLTDEMEDRPLRTLRGESRSAVKPAAESAGRGYRYAVIGELCDKAPDIPQWDRVRFGLPHYHFPDENTFNGQTFFSTDWNRCHVIEVCPFRAWSLILRHTPDYDMVNAYNLGLLSLLVYKNEVMADPDKTEDMREYIRTPDTTTSFFYQQCFDLSRAPVLEDSFNYPAIVTDVPFRERYSPAVFLDASQSKDYEKGDHDTKMFFVENASQIIVAWRGTASRRSVLTDATYQPVLCPAELVPGGESKVHLGFLGAYQCIGKYFSEEIRELRKTTKRKELFITGHSLGGTLGLLQAAELRDNHPLLYTYGMPRVLTVSGAKFLSSLTHFRHVNDADTVTSVPFDTNMDSWLFDVGGSLGTALGALWTSFTLSTIPLQKSLPDFGEVYCHHGHPVSFFRARQIGEEIQYTHTGATTGKKRWRMNGEFQFYLFPGIQASINKDLQNEQAELMRLSAADKRMLEDVFQPLNNPRLDTLITMPLDHFMGSQYQVIINNRLLNMLAPAKTPSLNAARQRFEALINHHDAYPLNAKRNTTFIALEDSLKYAVTQDISKNTVLKHAIERYKEDTYEITVS